MILAGALCVAFSVWRTSPHDPAQIDAFVQVGYRQPGDYTGDGCVDLDDWLLVAGGLDDPCSQWTFDDTLLVLGNWEQCATIAPPCEPWPTWDVLYDKGLTDGMRAWNADGQRLWQGDPIRTGWYVVRVGGP